MLRYTATATRRTRQSTRRLVSGSNVCADSSVIVSSVSIPHRRRFSVARQSTIVVKTDQQPIKPTTLAPNTVPNVSSSSSAGVFGGGVGGGVSVTSSSPSSSSLPPQPPPHSDVDLALTLETGLGSSFRHLLTSSQRLLLLSIKQHIMHTRSILKSHAYLSSEDSRWLKLAVQASEDLFLITVVGEFNAGKSNLLNSLLGGQHCQTGVLPTTEQINILRYGQTKEIVTESPNVVSILLPLPFLKEVSFCDTPGTNAILASHELLTKSFLPRADLVLFLTSVDRPFTRSEQDFLKEISAWKKKVVLVVNKIDLIKKEEDRAKIIQFVHTNAKQVLIDQHDDLRILPISAEQALQSKLILSDPSSSSDARHAATVSLASSGLPELERYIFETLTGPEKIALKLHTPLGITDSVLHKYVERLEQREEIWREVDRSILVRLETQRSECEQQLLKDITLSQHRLKDVFQRVQQRSETFVRDRLQLKNARELLFGDNLKSDYETIVYGSLSKDIESIFTSTFDSIGDSTRRTSSKMMFEIRQRLNELSHLNQRDGLSPSKALTQALEEDRMHIIEEDQLSGPGRPGSHAAFVNLQQDSNEFMTPQDQGSILANEARSAVIHTAVLEVVSLSLGTTFLMNALSVVALAAVPGYLAGGGWLTLGMAGAYALPYIRKRMTHELRLKIEKHDLAIQNIFQRAVEEQREQAIKQIQQQVHTTTDIDTCKQDGSSTITITN